MYFEDLQTAIFLDGKSAPVEKMSPPPPSEKPAPSTPPASIAADSQKSSQQIDHENVLATPAVRRLAREKNVNLSVVKGTGRNGRIMKEDVLAFASGSVGAIQPPPSDPVSSTSSPPRHQTKPVPELEGDQFKPLSVIQKAMFRVMTESLSIPHFGYRDDCDVSQLSEMRRKLKNAKTLGRHTKEAKVTFMPFFIKAASMALKQYPILNAALDTSGPEPKILLKASHNIAVAMDTPDGLLVPCIKNVQQLTVFEISEELQRLQELGSKGKLSPADLSGGTFTLSNIGAIGGTYASPVLTAPQVCIGAIGRVQRVARVISVEDPNDSDKEIERVKPMSIVYLSWSADHRIIDGATVARFSNEFKRYVENPTLMIMNMK